MRLSTRIALSVTVLVPVLVLTAGLLVLGLVSRDLRHQQDGRLQDRARAVEPDARTLLAAEQNGRPRVEQTQHRKVFEDALDSGVRVTSASGQVVLSGGPLPGEAVALPAKPGGPVTVRANGRAWRVFTVQITGPAPGTLWVTSSATATAPQVTAVRDRVLLVAALSAPVGGLLAFGLADRATVGLRRLSRRAAELDPRQGAAAFTHRASHLTEVDELADAIKLSLTRYDEQAARTAQALETARSFSSAASHELRTPLMSLRTNLDVLAAHPDLPVEERAEVLRDLQTDHARMLELLTALRALAQGDLVEASAFAPLDLSELLDQAVGEAARHSPEAVIGSEVPPGVRVFGWEAGLRILLANLLTNAVVHGHQPGEPARLLVRLRSEGDWAVLTVDDSGPGIPPEARTAVFNRFQRRPDSPGSGLGLTLVAQQAALHRGTAIATEPPTGTGCRLEIRLPLLRPETATIELPAHRDWFSGEH